MQKAGVDFFTAYSYVRQEMKGISFSKLTLDLTSVAKTWSVGVRKGPITSRTRSQKLFSPNIF